MTSGFPKLQSRACLYLFGAAAAFSILALLMTRFVLVGYLSPGTELVGDAAQFERMAAASLHDLRSGGWSAWAFKADGEGVPSIAAALYYLFGHHPAVVVICNALLHAGAVTALACLLSRLAPWRAAVIAVLPYLLSPYQLHWYAYLNKDSFNAFGLMLFLLGALDAMERDRPLRRSLMLAAVGAFFIVLNRPYACRILSVALTGMIAAEAVAMLLIGGGLRVLAGRTLRAGAVLAVLVVIPLLVPPSISDHTLHAIGVQRCAPTNWTFLSPLTAPIERPLCIVVRQRDNYAFIRTDANPTTRALTYDLDRRITGTLDALTYLPRAFVLGLLSPFPSEWDLLRQATPRSMFRTVVGFEMIVVYVGLGALLGSLFRPHPWRVPWLMALTVSVISVYGLGTPHLGTLNRYRYPYLMACVATGLALLLAARSNRSAGRDESSRAFVASASVV